VTLLPPGLVLQVWRLQTARSGEQAESESTDRQRGWDAATGGRSGNETRISRQSRLLNGDQLK